MCSGCPDQFESMGMLLWVIQAAAVPMMLTKRDMPVSVNALPGLGVRCSHSAVLPRCGLKLLYVFVQSTVIDFHRTEYICIEPLYLQ